MEGKNGIKITKFWSCVNGRNVEVDATAINWDEMPSSSSSIASYTSTYDAGRVNRSLFETSELAVTADSTSTAPTLVSSSTTGQQAGNAAPAPATSAAFNWEDEGPADSTVSLDNVELQPLGLGFDGDAKDLAGAEEFDANEFDTRVSQVEHTDGATVEENPDLDLLWKLGTSADISLQFNKFDDDFNIAFDVLHSS